MPKNNFLKRRCNGNEPTQRVLESILKASTDNRLQLHSGFGKSIQHGAHKFARYPARLAASRKGIDCGATSFAFDIGARPSSASAGRLQRPINATSIPSCLVFRQNVSKPAARSSEPRHHSADRHLRSRSNLTIGQSVEIA